MVNGPLGVLSIVLAVCEGTGAGGQIAGVAIALVGLVVWIGTIWLIVGSERDAEERKALGAILVASASIGVTVMVTAHLALEQLILLSLGAAMAIGIAGVLFSGRIGMLRGISAAAMGSLSLPIGVVLLLILHVSVGSGCLGEELG